MRACLALVLALPLQPNFVFASDACSSLAITAGAEVTGSDGSEFRTESYYHSKDGAAIRHIDDRDRIVAVDGPIGWAREGERAQIGPEFYKLFALGHQYHALLLEFDSIVGNTRENTDIEFGGEMLTATSGDYPYGGRVHLVQGDDPSRPAGLRFDFPDDKVIHASFLGWKKHGDKMLPYHIRVDDGERTFDYRYTSVSVSAESPLWFFDAVPAPPLDELRVYRLHRKILAAHCIGDADLIASLSAPVVHSVNRGNVETATNAELHARFSTLFDALDYSQYHDLAEPVIEVSGDVGWIAVNTRAIGTEKSSGRAFDDQWAWIMTVRRIGGDWLHTANASNRLE